MAERLQLSASHLTAGQPLLWDVYDGAGKLLLSRGILLEDEAQVAALLKRGMYVDAAAMLGTQATRDAPQVRAYDPFWVWEEVNIKLRLHLRQGINEENFPDKMSVIAKQLLELCDKSPEAALAAPVLLMTAERYPIIHSVHTAILSDLLARRQGWDEARRLPLCCAALTMNVAMIDLQTMLTMQKNPITDEQRARVTAHPRQGFDMLRKAGVTSTQWLRGVLEHHESPKGNGYPNSIKSMCEEALLIRTADIFGAKVAPRATRQAMTADQASKVFYVEESGHGNVLNGVLIKEIGIFAPGCNVKLKNGEVGIVAKRGATASTPIVFSLTNPKGIAIPDPVRRDTANADFAIISTVPREKIPFTIDPKKIWR